ESLAHTRRHLRCRRVLGETVAELGIQKKKSLADPVDEFRCHAVVKDGVDAVPGKPYLRPVREDAHLACRPVRIDLHDKRELVAPGAVRDDKVIDPAAPEADKVTNLQLIDVEVEVLEERVLVVAHEDVEVVRTV